MILTQSARILDFNQRTGRGGVHAVEPTVDVRDDGPPPLGASCAQDMREDDAVGAENNPITTLEELLIMVNRQRTGGGQRTPGNRRAAGGDRQPRGGIDRQTTRAPRKCANCGKEHEARICPHPAVLREQRACWTCGKQGHSSKDCPSKPQRSAVKAVEDQLPFFGGACAVVDADGYRQPRRPGRPQPRGATLGDFMKTPTRNGFAGLMDEGDLTTTTTTGAAVSKERTSATTTNYENHNYEHY